MPTVDRQMGRAMNRREHRFIRPPRDNEREAFAFQAARERIRQLIAEEYGIPITERSERILSDAEGDLMQMDRVEMDATEFRTHVHRVRRMGDAARDASRHMRDFGGAVQRFGNTINTIDWGEYQPDTTAGNTFVMSVYNQRGWAPQTHGYYYDYDHYQIGQGTTMANTYIDPVWHSWQSSASTTASYVLTNREMAGTEWFQYQPINQYQNQTWLRWEATPFSYVRLYGDRDREPVPFGMMRDWQTGEIITADEYAARQVEREAAANLRREQDMANRLERDAQRREAELRADSLLTSILDAHQRATYVEKGVVELVTPSGRMMHLEKRWAGNAVEVCPRTGRRLRRFCIHPRESLPIADNLAAQVLLLMTDEALFFKTANASMV